MDIAYFISDLLGQQGELSVPNLGYFVQIREKAFYDQENKKFFPPSYSVQFDPQVIDDDDTLAAYITDLKKISLASAKYFIEKYIANLKNQVVIEDVPFANLGTFSSDGVKLTFQSGAKTDDPAFFALPPLNVSRVNEQPIIEKPAVITEESAVSTTQQPQIEPAAADDTPPPVIRVEDTAANAGETSEEYIEEDEPARSMSVWIILLIVITVLAIAFAVVYKLRPDLLKAVLPKNTATETKATATPVPIKKIDTLSTQATTGTDTIIKPDTTKASVKTPAVTTQKTIQPVAVSTAAAAHTPVSQDSITKGSWIIHSQVFPTKSGAEARIDVLKGRGFAQARLESANVKRGGNYKVMLGVYKTKAEALSAKDDLLATGKIKKSEISIDQYK